MQFQRLQDKRSMAFDRARSLAIVADDWVCQQEHVRLPLVLEDAKPEARYWRPALLQNLWLGACWFCRLYLVFAVDTSHRPSMKILHLKPNRAKSRAMPRPNP